MKTMTEIEKHIYVHYNMLTAEDRQTDETPLNTPSLKRKLEELHTVNFASPSATALHDLVCAFAKPGLRWLEIERVATTFPLDILRSLKPSLAVMVDENQQRLMQHSLTHILYQRVELRCSNVLFRCVDLAQVIPIEADHKFDLVTAVGSLNRFFKSRESARQLFKNMAAYLAVDGHLVCVFRSGDHLLPSSTQRQAKRPRNLDLHSPLKEILGAPFGWLVTPSAQSVSHDTPFGEVLDAYCIQPHQQDATTEYLVFCDTVFKLARECGLTVVEEYPQEVKRHFSPTSNNTATPFKRFVDTYYIAMVFKKTQ